MNLKTLVKKILNISENIEEITKAVVYSYFKKEKYEYNKSNFFIKYFSNMNKKILNETYRLIDNNIENMNIYTLVNIFELLLSKEQIKEYGAVYTPQPIKEFIIEELIKNDDINVNTKFLDPACGCGSIIISLAEYINKKYGLSYCNIFKTMIFGIDIDKDSIFKAELLSRILAITNNEVLDEEFTFNYICGNSLDKLTLKKIKTKKIDFIIANPPYVRSRNINTDVKKFLKDFKTSNIGNVDLYIPFFEIGLEVLSSKGRMGYITPNTFIKSLNGRNLRKYLLNYEKLDMIIYDFKDNVVFENALNYTSVSIINKDARFWKLKYTTIDKNINVDDNYAEFNKEDLINKDAWKLNKNRIYNNIEKLESYELKLGDFGIKNGLATLKNDLYFFNVEKEDEKYYYRYYNNKEYKIEKEICIDIIKPNILKEKNDFLKKIEKGIFPYKLTNGKYCIISEEEMKSKYQKTYEFLEQYKEVLLNRDKGKGDYPAWYAYGRTQGMNNFGKKLLIPYIANEPYSYIAEQKNLLFYCGYALFSDDTSKLIILKKIIESSVFKYYIDNTSKPYSDGYMSYAKNYIKNFSIPNLTEEDKDFLINENDKTKINEYICKLYSINF